GLQRSRGDSSAFRHESRAGFPTETVCETRSRVGLRKRTADKKRARDRIDHCETAASAACPAGIGSPGPFDNREGKFDRPARENGAVPPATGRNPNDTSRDYR